MRYKRDNIYIFCVDTDSYAGNFERPLCAWMTGVYGECGVGEDEAKLYTNEGLAPLEDLVAQLPDDRGVYRPASIEPTPGWFNDGHGTHYREAAHDKLVVIEGLTKAYKKQIEDIRKIYQHIPSYAEEQVKEWEAKIANPRFVKYPAYNSVGIALNRQPTPAEIDFLKSRAIKYQALKLEDNPLLSEGRSRWISKFKIEGFRLLYEKIQVQTLLAESV